jgi:hypothetical protein
MRTAGLHAGIPNYMSGANRVTRVYNVTGVLWLQCVVHVMLFSMTTFCTLTSVPSKYVHSAQCDCFL